jgi:hypothetical protein
MAGPGPQVLTHCEVTWPGRPAPYVRVVSEYNSMSTFGNVRQYAALRATQVAA